MSKASLSLPPRPGTGARGPLSRTGLSLFLLVHSGQGARQDFEEREVTGPPAASLTHLGAQKEFPSSFDKSTSRLLRMIHEYGAAEGSHRHSQDAHGAGAGHFLSPPPHPILPLQFTAVPASSWEQECFSNHFYFMGTEAPVANVPFNVFLWLFL